VTKDKKPTVSEGENGMTRRGVFQGLAVMLLLIVAVGAGTGAAAQVAPPWRSQAAPLPTTTILVGDDTLVVELANTPASRSRGLGYRAGLAPGTGMLFVNDEPRPQSFWMKGMRFCLDIVWIERGQIVGAAESVCPAPAGTLDADQQRYQSPIAVGYVLEVPAGWLAANGYGVGTPVVIELPVSTG